MSIVPDWISKEDFARALFLVLGALLTALKDGFRGAGRLLVRWIREMRQSRKAIVIVQDFLQPGLENLWHIVQLQSRNTMHFIGHFRVTNTTDKPLTFTNIDFPHPPSSRIFHVRMSQRLDSDVSTSAIPAHSCTDLRLEFGLDPAPDWIGERKLKLLLTDSAVGASPLVGSR